MKKVIVLSSGGLDSTTVIYDLISNKYKVKPIFFDYGQHCVKTEWERLNDVLPKQSDEPEYINISDLFRGSKSRLITEANLWKDDIKDDDLYVPYRTLLFLSAASARAQTLNITEVFAGFINSNHAKEIDCSCEFLNSIDNLTENIGPVRIKLPFRHMSKSDVARKAIELEVPIGKTFSCQAMSKFPCGACPNCVERLAALRETGLLT
ncbi:ExsB family transcriptional regulator [Brenneria alni]|uniref:7-cyano-7-deazaguanine synthase n=1 Tax=Brenneria alni TaxID=71656 RepID=A0A421DJA5_9GAMM|nr:7-cyano-7-deazaguanine synthase [Brenneria alni]RLM18006.1 ExsB family transcriptional regulator [Brenneria alni]